VNAKDEIVALVNRMPANATFDAISEKIETIAALRRSQASVAAGRVKSHDEVKRWFHELSREWKAK
jgi:hypothetical protein